MAARDPLGRVAAVRTRREANHLASELRFSLQNEQLPAHEEHEHEEALSLLEDRFPAAPRRATRPRPPAHEGRRRRATPRPAQTETKPAPKPSLRARAGAATRAAAPTREAASAAGTVGDLASPLTDSATDVMLGAARAGLLLALLYLILSNRGSKGLSGVLNVFTGASTAFFSAHGDPLAALNGPNWPTNPIGLTTPVTPANDPTADPTGRPQDIPPHTRIVAGMPDFTADPTGRPQDIPRRPLVPRKPVTRRSH